jgi:hypothetical protein
MSAEIVEERLAVKGSVACAGVPTGTSFVDPVIALGDGLEGPSGRGGGRDLNRRGRCWLAWLVRLGEVIEERIEVADAATEGLVDSRDERSPERDDCAGSSSGAGGAGDEHRGSVSGVSGAGDIGNAAAVFSSGTEGNAGVALP